jgi:hypothetical protein
MTNKTMKRKRCGGGPRFSKQKTPIKSKTPDTPPKKNSKRVTFKNSPDKKSPEERYLEEMAKSKKRSTVEVLTAKAKEEGITRKGDIKAFVDQGIKLMRQKHQSVKKINTYTLVRLHNRENSKEAKFARMIEDMKYNKDNLT